MIKYSQRWWILGVGLGALLLDRLFPMHTNTVQALPPLVIPLIMAGASIISGYLKSRNQNSSTTATNMTTNSTTTPTMDPAYKGIQSIAIRQVMQRLQEGSQGAAKGITNTRMSGINQLFNNLGLAQKNTLAANGMMNAGGGNQAAGAKINLEQARGGELAKILADEPLLDEQFNHQNLMDAMGLMTQGRGSSTTTTQVGTGSGTGTATSGGGAAGALDGGASILGMMYANGAFDPSKKPGKKASPYSDDPEL